MSRYTLVVTPWGYPHVSRTLVLSGRHSLEELHFAILKTFNLTDDHLHAFFLNDHAWDLEFGYFSRPDLGQKDTAGTKLDALALVRAKRFLYLFDYGSEQRFGVRVAEIDVTGEEPEEPQLIDSVGTVPPQHGPDDDAPDDDVPPARTTAPDPAWRDLVDRIVACLPQKANEDARDDFDEEDIAAEEMPGRAIAEQLLVANELLDRTGADEAQLDRVADWSGKDVVDWLLDLPHALVTRGQIAEAWALSQRLLPFSFGEIIEPATALWAVNLGEGERARGIIESLLAKHPEHASVLTEVGFAWEELGEAAEAEQCFRKALRFAGSELRVREEAVAALVRSLEAQGRTVEARQVEQSEVRWRRRFLSSSTLVQDGTPVRNEGPKVGRNDPCPCGSSKKYKKCCGVAA